MPVLRENIETGGVRPGGVIAANHQAAAEAALGQAAKSTAAIAGQLGRILATENERTAVALAQQAAVSLDDNGVPQIDRASRTRVSLAARHAYDETLDGRFEAELQAAVHARLADARNRNPVDALAFQTEASAIAAGMAESVPEAFQSRFKTIARHYAAQFGASVGYNQEQALRQRKASDFVATVSRAEDDVLLMAQAGDLEGAHARAQETLAIGDGLERQLIINPTQSRTAAVALEAKIGEGHVLNLIANDERPKWQVLEEWETKFRVSHGDAVAIVKNKEAREAIATRLSVLGAQAKSEAAAVEQARTKQADLWLVMNGGADNTKESRELLNEGIAPYNGGFEPDMTFWLQPQSTNATMWQEIARSGRLPSSLIHAFNAYETLSPEGKELVFRHWQRLSYDTAPDGSRFAAEDLAGMPPEVERKLVLTDALLEMGIEGDDFEMVQQRVSTLLAGEIDDYALYQMAKADDPQRSVLRRGRAEAVPFFSGADSFQSDLAGWTLSRFEEEADGWVENERVLGRDAKRAATAIRYLMATGTVDDIDDAFDRVFSYYKQRYPETGAVYNPRGGGMVDRSWAAPEVRYAVPPEWRGRAWQQLIAGNPAEAVNVFGDDVMAYMTGDDWWHVTADRMIRQHLDPEDLGEEALPEGLLQPGDHFGLEPVGGDRMRPLYTVHVFDGTRWNPLMTESGAPYRLNLRSAYAEVMGARHAERQREAEEWQHSRELERQPGGNVDHPGRPDKLDDPLQEAIE